MMEIRLKLFWRFLALLIIVILTITFTEKIIEGASFSLREWFLVIGYPLLFYMGVFMAPTMRIQLSKQGISVYWKVGLGSLKIWEQTDYHIGWTSLARVGSIFPIWLPFHFIGITGHQGTKMRMFFLGALTTKKKKSLVYIADHAKPNVIEDDVQKLVNKYRQELEKQKARAT